MGFVGDLLFPGDNRAKKTSYLQPSDQYSIKWLAYVRLFAAVYFTFHATLVVVATFEDFWKYLTNLTYIAVMLAYQVLLYAHLVNKDFGKNEYQEPTSAELGQGGFRVYRLGIFLYELAVHMTLTVAFAFWLIEMPALALEGNVYEWQFMNWFELIFSHTLPQLVMFAEWSQSNI